MTSETVPERLARLDERVRNIKDDVEHIAKRLDEIHSMIQRGKGAKWAILTFASAIAGVIGAYAHKLFPFLKG